MARRAWSTSRIVGGVRSMAPPRRTAKALGNGSEVVSVRRGEAGLKLGQAAHAKRRREQRLQVVPSAAVQRISDYRGHSDITLGQYALDGLPKPLLTALLTALLNDLIEPGGFAQHRHVEPRS